MDLAEFRSQFPALRTRAYLFAGALTPAAKPVRAAWDDWTGSWEYDPNYVYTGPMMTGRMDELRAAFGAADRRRSGVGDADRQHLPGGEHRGRHPRGAARART